METGATVIPVVSGGTAKGRAKWLSLSRFVFLSGILMGGAALLALVILCVVGVSFYLVRTKDPFIIATPKDTMDYGMVVDAGSHGSRLYVFNWQKRSQNPLYPDTVPVAYPKQVAYFEQSPGISSLATTPDPTNTDQKDVSLRPLLAEAKKYFETEGIHGELQKNYPIFIYATAGMRNMDERSRSEIMRSVQTYFSNSSLSPFMFQDDWARVLSGEEEGVFGWLTVNSAFRTTFVPPQESIGALDMGGASMQIAFEPAGSSVLESLSKITLAGKRLFLYSHSFLGYGVNDGFRRLTTGAAVEHIVTANSLTTPALHAGTPDGTSDKSSSGESQKISPQTPDKTPAESFAAHSPPQIRLLDIPADATSDDVVSYTVNHPCLPRGYVLEFPMPSLQYPEGRYYVDVPLDQMKAYMRLLGLPDDVIAETLRATTTSPLVSDTMATDSVQRQLDAENDTHSYYGKPYEPLLLPKQFLENLMTEDDDVFSGNWNLELAEIETVKFFRPADEQLPIGNSSGQKWLVQFVGTGNATECRTRSETLFYDEPCFIHSCSFNGAYQPALANAKFVASGVYSQIGEALGLVGKYASVADLKAASDELCTLSLEDLQTMKRNAPERFTTFSNNNIAELCWKLIWSTTALEYGYGFPENARMVAFAPPRDDRGEILTPFDAAAAGWTPGALFYEINSRPAQRLERVYQWTNLETFLVVAVIFSALLCIFQVVQLFMQHRFIRVTKRYLLQSETQQQPVFLPRVQ